MSEELNITIDDLIDSQKEIAELIGLDNYIKLVKHFGGDSPYIQVYDTLMKSTRNSEIRQDFNGYNFREVALKHRLSQRQVRNIIPRKIIVEKRQKPIDGQTKLY